MPADSSGSDRCSPRCGGPPRHEPPLSYSGVSHRGDSSAPHSTRLMMAGGYCTMVTAVGSVHCVPGGACGGEIRIAECEWLFLGGWTVSQTAVRQVRWAAAPPAVGVIGASIRRVTATCTVVVVPTNTGSVLQGPGLSPPSSTDRRRCPPGSRGFGFILGLIPRPQSPSGAWRTSGSTGQVASQRHQ